MLYSVELRSQKKLPIYSPGCKNIDLFLRTQAFVHFCYINQHMKIEFWTVGKAHEPYIKEGIELFTKRIASYFPVEWKIIPMPKNAASFTESEGKKKEGEMILALLKKEDYLVLLDERGKQLSSEELATFIQTRANESSRTVIFLIGGAYGVSDTVINRANYQWSLSKLVFPHQLVRLILSEQIYRACTIIRNEKYHHS
jgi:23S rRNA (pseudouridine1915-N3)-methyltransferase